jgi:hypothetical protein
MRLVFRNSVDSRECDWESYALLRDNVQHYIERGRTSSEFEHLHSIARAIDTGKCLVDALRLRTEVLRAASALRSVQLDVAAVSPRTRAIMLGEWHAVGMGHTVESRMAGWALPVAGLPSDSVPHAAEHFVTAVLDVTRSAADRELLEVERLADEGHSAR